MLRARLTASQYHQLRGNEEETIGNALEVERDTRDDPIVHMEALEQHVRVEDDVCPPPAISICLSQRTKEAKGDEARTGREQQAPGSGHDHVEGAVVGDEDPHEAGEEEDEEEGVEVGSHRGEVVFGLQERESGHPSQLTAAISRRDCQRSASERTWSVKSVRPRKTNVVITSACNTTA